MYGFAPLQGANSANYRPTRALRASSERASEACVGNTRTTWHLRNYLLMLDGHRPLIDLADEDADKSAWWSATAHDHEALDAIVITS